MKNKKSPNRGTKIFFLSLFDLHTEQTAQQARVM